jgi:hypothetical protein
VGGSGGPPQVGRRPPEDPAFYVDWAKGNVKEFNKTANTFLSQILGLSASLLAGSVALWKNLDIQWPFKVSMVVLWSICVCVALFSFAPIEDEMDLSSASDIRDVMERTFAAKRRKIRIVKWAFAIAIVAATSGLLLGDTAQMQALWR